MKQPVKSLIVFTILLALASLMLTACDASEQQMAPSTAATLTPAAEQTEPEMMGEGAVAEANASAASAPASAQPGHEMPEMMAEGEIAEAEFDQMFIDMMVPHHQGAVEMARIAQERAEHPEIRQLAENVIAAQETEIEQMQQWRQEWYGSSDTPSMSEMPSLHGMPDMGEAGHAMDMADEVKQLRNAAEPFDRAFIEAMIPHHQSAIDAARLAEQATRPEIKELAQAVIEDQQREIDQMNQWLQAWYGEAEATPAP